MISLDSAGLFSSLFLKQDPALAAAESARANQSPSDDDGDDSPNTVFAASLAYRRAERTTLQIRTQEGDVVQLKFNVKDRLRAETATVQDDETVISELSVRARSTTRLKISVQGDLNTDELAAIQSVVEQAGALANEFFAGGTADAAALASSLELNPEQLDQVRLRLSLRERLTYTQIGASPATLPASPTGSGSTDVADAVGAPVAASPTDPVPADVESTDAPTAAPAPLFPEILSAFEAIAAFLTGLLEALSAAPEPSEASEASDDTGIIALRYDVSFKLRVFQSILVSVSDAASDDQDDSVPPIIDEALDNLAAQQQPALEIVV